MSKAEREGVSCHLYDANGLDDRPVSPVYVTRHVVSHLLVRPLLNVHLTHNFSVLHMSFKLLTEHFCAVRFLLFAPFNAVIDNVLGSSFSINQSI